MTALLLVSKSSAQTSRNAQQGDDSTTLSLLPSSTISPASSTSSIPAGYTTAVVPIFLLLAAESMLSEYFPSSTPTNLASIEWPSKVTIGTAVYAFDSATSTAATTKETSPTAAPNKSEKQSKSDGGDSLSQRDVAIIIGVVIGAIALLVMAGVFWCLHRRRRDNGSFFLRRSSASTISSGGGSSRLRDPTLPPMDETSYASGALGAWRTHRQPEPAPTNVWAPPPPQQQYHQESNGVHPALIQHQSSRSTSEDRPFVTPRGSYEHGSSRSQTTELDHHEPAQRRSSSQRRSLSSVRDSRPPTPFNPLMMASMPGSSNQPPPRLQTQPHQNPFTSPEDPREADDLVSPILPSRSPERRHSPMVHYPSFDEVSEFDFASGVRKHRSYEDGGDGWRAVPARKPVRHELA